MKTDTLKAEKAEKAEIIVISASLNPKSRSRLLAKAAHSRAAAKKPTAWLDLQEFPLPLCDGGASYGDPNVIEITKQITQAKAILIATPIYNFDVNAALKNLIELTGKAWEGKLVGFICAAGGKSSYMSVMSVANSLMLDFRTIIIPRFVYADGDAFTGDTPSPSIVDRLNALCDETITLSDKLAISH